MPPIRLEHFVMDKNRMYLCGLAEILYRDLSILDSYKGAFHLVRTHLGGGWVGSSLLYISIAYYMGWVGPDSM